MFTANETVKECADEKTAKAAETVVSSLLPTDPKSKTDVGNTREIASVPSMAEKNVSREYFLISVYSLFNWHFRRIAANLK